MRRGIKTDQGGSVATFVVIAIILTIVLFGSILYLKQHSEQARRDQAIAEYEKQKKTETTEKTETVKVVKASESVASAPVSTPAVAATASASLPNTGPGSVFAESIGVFMLTTAIASYFGSRRTLSRYL